MSIVSIAKPGSTFLPTQIQPGSCQLWLDGSDSTTITGTTAVSAWTDKSGNGNNTTIFGTPNSTYGTINSVKAMWFNGSSGTYGLFSNTGATVSGFVVGTMNSATATYGRMIALGNNPGNDDSGTLQCPFLLRHVGNQAFSTRRFQTDRTYSSYTYNAPFLASIIYDGTNGNLYVNGSTIVQFGSTGNFGYSNYSVGCGIYSISANTVDTWTGFVGEVILYRSALTTPQQQQVEGYLAQKWGLTSQLPAGHPGLTQTFYGTARSTVVVPITLLPFNIYTNYNPLTATGSTCILWLDASDPTTLFSDPAGTTLATVSGTVGYWRDKSSSGFNCTQTTLSYRPTYVAAAKNGRSILSFNGLTNFLNMPQFTAVPLTIFFVAQGTVFLPNTFFLSLGNAGSTVMMRMLNSPEYYGVDGTSSLLISTTNADINWHLWTLTISSTTVTFYFDGVIVGTSSWSNGSAYTFATNTIASWNQQVGGKATTLRIPEILFYSAVLGTTQQRQVESYLTEKWGLVSQPTRGVASIRSISKYVPVQYTQIFTYTTGVNQTFAVPATTTSISVYMWGAGGAGGYSGVGGAGAFLGGLLPVTPNSSLTVIVGQGGTVNGTSAFGGGGVGSVGGWTGGGGGGGYSGVFNGSTPLVIVGAGGGAAFYNAVGGCGDSVTGTGIRGTTNGATQSGYGGTQIAGGAGGTGGLANGSAGSYLQGGAGDPSWSAGGGGGYYGGGGGATDNGIGGSGAGGSSYSTLLSNIVASNSPNTGANPPNTSSTYYVSGVAAGGSNYNVVGGNGRVVFVYTA